MSSTTTQTLALPEHGRRRPGTAGAVASVVPPPGCDCPCPEANSTYAATVAGAVVTVGIADMRRRGSSGRVDSFASLDFFGVINIELEAKIGKGVNSETQSGSIGLPPGISISVPIGGPI